MPTHVTVLPEDEPKCVEASWLETEPRQSQVDWRPTENKRVLFLRSQESCPVRQLMQNSGASIFGEFFHVAVCDDRLIVTEADTIECPGRILIGVLISEDETTSTFALQTQPPTGLTPARHLAAEGYATLTWGRAPHLHIRARLKGQHSGHDLVIDAIE